MARRPDFKLLEGVVAPRILHAARVASEAMYRAGIRHALIGGLAVGAYGYVRATTGVDFLVGDEAYERHAGGIVNFKPGVPIAVNGVAVDVLSDVLVDLDDPIDSEGIPIVEPEWLVYLKLRSHRRRDKEDVIELLKTGLDEDSIRACVQTIAPELLDRFDALAELADEEE